MRTSTLASILALSLTGSLLAQSSRNMTLLSKIPHSPCTTGDVWALDNNHMLIARRRGLQVRLDDAREVDGLDAQGHLARIACAEDN